MKRRALKTKISEREGRCLGNHCQTKVFGFFCEKCLGKKKETKTEIQNTWVPWL